MSTATGSLTQEGKLKTVSRIGIINLDESRSRLLSECFRQFSIEPVALTGVVATRLWKEKYEGVVVELDDDCEAILKAVRTSPSNKHILIYGITPDTKTAMKYSQYGVNALFFEPLERSAALRVVRSTNLLVLHEYRRYVRIPVAVEALLESEKSRVSTLTVDVSSGGLSLSSENMMWEGRAVKATLELPGAQKVTLRARICWRREKEKTLGVNFEPDDPARLVIREWIDEFLKFV